MTSSVSAEADTAVVAIPFTELFAEFIAWADQHPEHTHFFLSSDRRWPSVDFTNITLDEARQLLAVIPWEQRYSWGPLGPPELLLNAGNPSLWGAHGHAFGLAVHVVAVVRDGDQ